MKVLAYAPSCEAYIETKTKGGSKFYDLSDDIVNMTVNRVGMGSSSFSLTLQNVNFKYNGLFRPMDRIVLYCTKKKRVRLLTGYVTTCDVFSLYQKDFNLSGKCSLYRLEQLYWDPCLDASQQLLQKTKNTKGQWGGFAETIRDLLVTVGGWDNGSVIIGDLPQDAINYAYEMYQHGQDYSNQIKERIDEFYEILQTHGPSVSGGSSGGGDDSSGDGTPIDSSAIKKVEDLPKSIQDEIKKCSKERQTVVGRAVQQLGKPYVWGAVGPNSFDCSGLVGYCLTGKYERLGTTNTFMGWKESTDHKPGDTLTTSSHAAVYIGGGKMIHAPHSGDVVKIAGVMGGMKYVVYPGLK